MHYIRAHISNSQDQDNCLNKFLLNQEMLVAVVLSFFFFDLLNDDGTVINYVCVILNQLASLLFV